MPFMVKLLRSEKHNLFERLGIFDHNLPQMADATHEHEIFDSPNVEEHFLERFGDTEEPGSGLA